MISTLDCMAELLLTYQVLPCRGFLASSVARTRRHHSTLHPKRTLHSQQDCRRQPGALPAQYEASFDQPNVPNPVKNVLSLLLAARGKASTCNHSM